MKSNLVSITSADVDMMQTLLQGVMDVLESRLFPVDALYNGGDALDALVNVQDILDKLKQDLGGV